MRRRTESVLRQSSPVIIATGHHGDMDRCACETRFDRCIRPATGDDGHCDGCRNVRPNGGTREHRIELVTEAELATMRADPETIWADAHYAVVTADQIDMATRLASRMAGRWP